MKNTDKPGGIILLGGKSQRMGTDKYLLPFFDLTLIERLILELEKVVQEVILVTNKPEKLSFLACKKYSDHYPIPSALTGLHSGLKHASSELNFVLACDLPLFDARMVDYLADQMNDAAEIAVPQTSKGFESLCALYSKKCIPEIERMFAEENYAIQDLFGRVNTAVIPAGQIMEATHPHVFFNMNTPGDYQEALNLARTL